MAALHPEEWQRAWHLWEAGGGGAIVVKPPFDEEWAAEQEKEPWIGLRYHWSDCIPEAQASREVGGAT